MIRTLVAQFRLGVRGRCGQRLQVVAEDFGRHVLFNRLLGQPGDVLQTEAMFEPLEGLFDAPALVIQIAESIGRKAGGSHQIGHQDAHGTVGCDVVPAADNRSRAAR